MNNFHSDTCHSNGTHKQATVAYCSKLTNIACVALNCDISAARLLHHVATVETGRRSVGGNDAAAVLAQLRDFITAARWYRPGARVACVV